MAKFITTIALILLCASPGDTQGSFTWALDREVISGADYIGTYKMFETDILSGTNNLLFEIHSDRFDHDARSDWEFKILSFVFTRDKDQVLITAPLIDQYLTVPAGNYTVIGNSTAKISIAQNTTTTLTEFADAVTATRYIDDANYRSSDEIQIEVRVWQGGLSGVTTTSYLYISDREEDIVLSYCQQDSIVIVDSDIPYSGQLFDMEQQLIPLILSLLEPTELSAIFVSDSYCPNTAVVDVIVFANPIIVSVEDAILCAGDTLFVDVFLQSSSQILWSDESEDPIFTVTAVGTYSYTITNEEGCTMSDTFIMDYSADPLNPLNPRSIKHRRL